MDSNYIKGQQLCIELDGECFIGEFLFLNQDRTRIELDNVYQNNDINEIMDGVQIFYKQDIISITVLNDDKNSKQLDCVENNNQMVNTVTKPPKQSELSNYDLQRIETLCKNSKVIYQTDRVYHEAIREMLTEDEIAINLESCETGRHAQTAIITISTRNNIYIFDVIYLGKVFPELKNILESKKPRKILHDGRTICDNLKFKQNVELQKVFDTYVVHLAIGGDKSIFDLNKCISHYFNLPDIFLTSVKGIDWSIRPFDITRQFITARRTALLFKLYDYFVHERMLSKFYKTCEMFSRVYSSNADSVEVATDMATNRSKSIDKICENDVELEMESVNDIDLEISNMSDKLSHITDLESQ